MVQAPHGPDAEERRFPGATDNGAVPNDDQPRRLGCLLDASQVDVQAALAHHESPSWRHDIHRRLAVGLDSAAELVARTGGLLASGERAEIRGGAPGLVLGNVKVRRRARDERRAPRAGRRRAQVAVEHGARRAVVCHRAARQICRVCLRLDAQPIVS